MDNAQNGNNRKAVYTIVEGSGDKKRWVRIGIAFVNRDGSYNVVLDALPVSGQLHIRDFPPRDEEENAGEGEPQASSRRPRASRTAA